MRRRHSLLVRERRKRHRVLNVEWQSVHVQGTLVRVFARLIDRFDRELLVVFEEGRRLVRTHGVLCAWQ